jgi:hypothetical protein
MLSILLNVVLLVIMPIGAFLLLIWWIRKQ